MSAGPAANPSGAARVLLVCTANITRSPIAALLLDAYLRRAVPPALLPVVSSAGTHARPGDPADPPMAAVARSWRLDPDGHRSRRIDRELASSQDLILTMELRHQQVVAGLGPRLAERTFRLTELAALCELAADGGVPPPVGATLGGDGVERVRSFAEVMHGLRARTVIDATDVADPHGGPDGPYVDTAWELAGLVETVGAALAASLQPTD